MQNSLENVQPCSLVNTDSSHSHAGVLNLSRNIKQFFTVLRGNLLPWEKVMRIISVIVCRIWELAIQCLAGRSTVLWAFVLFMPWTFSAAFLCWQTFAAVPWRVCWRILSKSTSVTANVCSLLAYLQWLEQLFYCLMSAHVSSIHLLACLNCMPKRRAHVAFSSKDKAEKKRFVTTSLWTCILRWIFCQMLCINSVLKINGNLKVNLKMAYGYISVLCYCVFYSRL